MSIKIDLSLIKELRDQTQAPINKCKEALESSGGDIKQAKAWLSERAMVFAAKKSDRTTGNGAVVLGFNKDKTKAAIVAFGCETDFVAKNEQFTIFATKIAEKILEKNDDCTLNAEEFGAIQLDNGKTVAEYTKEQVVIMGENVIPKSVSIISRNNDEIFESYVHNFYKQGVSGKIAGVIKIHSDNNNSPEIEKLARSMVLHTVVARPQFLNVEQAKKAGIAEEEYENCVILQQKYAMDGSTPITSMITAAGHNAVLTGFICAQIDG